MTAPVLIIFDPKEEITLEIDVSDYTIEACLSQKDSEGRLHSIAFYSRKISPAESNYDIYNKKLLVIVTVF
jgi:RNase H-like domain found in reverse transcriptase